MIKLLKPLSFQPNWQIKKSLVLKDHSLSKILQIKPELKDLLDQLIPLINQKQFLTIDYSELLLSPFVKTCKNTDWHIDGIDNNYLIISWGDCRTTFIDSVEYSTLISKLASLTQNVRLTNNCLDQSALYSLKNITPENGQPILYNSQDIHKGHTATHNGTRFFLRLCMSDYIKPTNRRLL